MFVETYKGYNIEQVSGYYYLSDNGDAEFKTLQECRNYIDNIYIPFLNAVYLLRIGIF